MTITKPTEVRFVFEISPGNILEGYPRILSDGELGRFGCVGPCASGIKKLLPVGSNAVCMLTRDSIQLVVTSDGAQQDIFDNFVEKAMKVIEELNIVARAVKKNSQMECPLPIKALSIRPGDLQVLQAFQKARERNGLEIAIQVDGECMELVVVESAEFTSGIASVTKNKVLRHKIVGLRRDDSIGHALFISEEEIRVRLPLDRWPFHSIEHVLRASTDFEGTIVKSSDGEWAATDDARLHTQDDAFPLG